jgi:hypothetical protein
MVQAFYVIVPLHCSSSVVRVVNLVQLQIPAIKRSMSKYRHEIKATHIFKCTAAAHVNVMTPTIL